MSRTTPYAFGVMRCCFVGRPFSSEPGPKETQRFAKKVRERAWGRRRREGEWRIARRVGSMATWIANLRSERMLSAAESFMLETGGSDRAVKEE